MKKHRPNILLITSDQHHHNALGYFNNNVHTPNLDKLAQQGAVFTRAYCTNPTCTPSRASIITGKYPSQHGAWSLGTKLPESEYTIGEDFQKAGYRTALVGKAHFQPTKSTEEFPSIEAYPKLHDFEFWRKFHGPFYGFEHVELLRNHVDEYLVGQHYALWMEEKGFKEWRNCFTPPVGLTPDQKHKWNIPEEYHYDAWIAERTTALMEEYRRNDENFFLWASFPDPHPPYLVPEPWDTMYAPKTITLPSITKGEHENNPPHFKLTQEHNPDFSGYNEPGGNGVFGFMSHLHNRNDLAKDTAVYYGMISLMDKYIGRILDSIHRSGQSENTLVVFTADHGHLMGQHGLIEKGAFHYEDLLKIPFIASYPGKIFQGWQCNSLQSLVDLAPTFLKIAGIDIPRTISGVDQSEVWFGNKEMARNHVVIENHHQPTTVNARTYINEQYKITVYHNQDYGEIFDLKSDPGEVNNLWNKKEFFKLKTDLFTKFLFAEMGKETLWMPRVAEA